MKWHYIYRHTLKTKQIYRHADIPTYRHTDRQTYRQAEIQTGRHTDIQTYRSYRHTDIQTDRHYIHTYIHIYIYAYMQGHAAPESWHDIKPRLFNPPKKNPAVRATDATDVYSRRSLTPFTPSRLEKHTNDGHHRQSSVSKFGTELLGFLSRVGRGQHLESKVACGSRSSSRLILGNFAEGHVGQDLTPSSKVSIVGI